MSGRAAAEHAGQKRMDGHLDCTTTPKGVGPPNSVEPLPAVNLTLTKELVMNWDRIEGNWKQAKGKIREQWGKLTDDDLDIIDGKREKLAGKIQHAYGVSKDEAEKQLAHFESRYRE
jgi:uncharacterized protein YjbJ (UPF0337 family)